MLKAFFTPVPPLALLAAARKLAAEDRARVFATDSILTTLMCIKSSIYSWDILVTRVGGKLFFDRRDNSNLSMLTVNETAPDPVPEEKDNMNGVQQLSLEATAINQNFSQQVCVCCAWGGGVVMAHRLPGSGNAGVVLRDILPPGQGFRRG